MSHIKVVGLEPVPLNTLYRVLHEVFGSSKNASREWTGVAKFVGIAAIVFLSKPRKILYGFQSTSRTGPGI